MRQMIREMWNHLRSNQTASRTARSSTRPRLHLESLEDRLTPSAAASGVLSGQVLVGAGSEALSGVTVTLTGTTVTNRGVNVSTTTDANGAYLFTNLLPGSYHLSRQTPGAFVDGGPGSVSSISLGQGQAKAFTLQVLGLSASQISLSDFTNIPSAITLPPAGAGSATGFSLSGLIPLLNQSLNASTSSFINLSGSFVDPDATNTPVTFHTSEGDISVTLFNKDAPETVANFLNYLQTNSLNNDLFHRMSSDDPAVATPAQVLQGGEFTASASGGTTSFTAVTPFRPIQNESNDAVHANTIGTLAVARTSDVNSGTSQFFFNLTDNSRAFAGSPHQGYTVFGQVADAQSLANLQKFTTDYTAEPATVLSSTFQTLPLRNGTTTLTASTPTSALALVNSVTFTPPTKLMTYQVVSDNSLVTPTLESVTGSLPLDQLKLTVGTLVGNTNPVATITVTATDSAGESVTSHFTVTVH